MNDTPEKKFSFSDTEVPTGTVMRAIIDTVGHDKLTLEEIMDRVGDAIGPTATQVPVEVCVGILLDQEQLHESDRPYHFELTEEGRLLYEADPVTSE